MTPPPSTPPAPTAAALDEIDRLRAELRACERQVDGERVINEQNGREIARLRAAWRTMQEEHTPWCEGDGSVHRPCCCGLSDRQAKERKVLEGI